MVVDKSEVIGRERSFRNLFTVRMSRTPVIMTQNYYYSCNKTNRVTNDDG